MYIRENELSLVSRLYAIAALALVAFPSLGMQVNYPGHVV